MTAPVKLPRRLPDSEPVRSDPPTEADSLRRAIRHCEHYCVDDDDSPADASFRAFERHSEIVDHVVLTAVGRQVGNAGWLPGELRRVMLAELRERLAASLEAEEAWRDRERLLVKQILAEYMCPQMDGAENTEEP